MSCAGSLLFTSVSPTRTALTPAFLSCWVCLESSIPLSETTITSPGIAGTIFIVVSMLTEKVARSRLLMPMTSLPK